MRGARLKVLDLFSGIGGFSLGLERTGGFETVAFCEIEPFPRKVLAKHWPGVPIFEDVRKLRGSDIGSVDVICGGFPCQDVSSAAFAHGRAGIGGARSGLYGELLRLAEELGRPTLIIENVKALMSGGIVTVLEDLCALGYNAGWHIIPASSVDLMQPRERVFIVADTSGERVERLVTAISLGKSGPWRACRQADMQQIIEGPFDERAHWPKPLIRGMADRPADWVDRLKALGNAVVPQIPEMIGRAILEATYD